MRRITAEDGAAGVEVAKRELPDLILMDVVMPNLNGFQATRSISKEPTTSHIPVILVTTKDQDTDKVWGMRQGAKAYITKPFSEAELIEVINAAAGGIARLIDGPSHAARVSALRRGSTSRRTPRAASRRPRAASSLSAARREHFDLDDLVARRLARQAASTQPQLAAAVRTRRDRSSTAPPSVGTLTRRAERGFPRRHRQRVQDVAAVDLELRGAAGTRSPAAGRRRRCALPRQADHLARAGSRRDASPRACVPSTPMRCCRPRRRASSGIASFARVSPGGGARAARRGPPPRPPPNSDSKKSLKPPPPPPPAKTSRSRRRRRRRRSPAAGGTPRPGR